MNLTEDKPIMRLIILLTIILIATNCSRKSDQLKTLEKYISAANSSDHVLMESILSADFKWVEDTLILNKEELIRSHHQKGIMIQIISMVQVFLHYPD